MPAPELRRTVPHAEPGAIVAVGVDETAVPANSGVRVAVTSEETGLRLWVPMVRGVLGERHVSLKFKI